MKIGFIDYCHPSEGFANRDQTGGFGSGMYASGLIGRLISKLKKGVRIPLISLGYLNAIAKKIGHETYVYSRLPKEELDIIIIASSMMHYKYELDLAQEIKIKNPDTKIGFIGPFSSEFPEKFEAFCDFIILGEPESEFEKLCQGLVEPKGLLKAKSLTDLNTLPFPDWSDFEIKEYGYSPSLPRKPMLTIQGSRGCTFACEFCPYLVTQGIPLRRRSNESILAEVEYLIKTYKIKSLLFRDITWSLNKPLTKELCKMIRDKSFDLDIGVETHIGTLDSELISLMSQARVKVVNLGIESPEDEIVRDSGRRPIKSDKVLNTIREMESYNIRVQAFYILGLIDDTKESMERTIEYSHFLNTYTAQYCVLTPFPGTKTYNDLKDRFLTNDFSKFTEYYPVVRLDNISEKDVMYYLDKAFNSYYMRFDWFKKNGLTAIRSFLKI